MTQIKVKSIDVEEKELDVYSLVKTADDLQITCQADYEASSDFLKTIKSRYKDLDAQRKKIVEPLNTAKNEIQALFNEPLKYLSNAETAVKKLMITYVNEQERIAKEEQRKLQELAEKEAARQQKILDEKIKRAEASGKDEKVEMLQQQKEEVIPLPVPVIAPEIEAPKGVSFRLKWTAKIIDENIIPREYLIVNTSGLDRVAQATKGSIKIPGVEFISEKILSSRS